MSKSNEAKRYMMRQLRVNPELFVDDLNVVNYTQLAEETADHFNLYGADFSVPAELEAMAKEATEEVGGFNL